MANLIKDRIQTVLPDYLKRNRPEKLAKKAGVGLDIVNDLRRGLDIPEHLLKSIFNVVKPDLMQDIFKTNDLAKGREAANKAAKYHLCIAVTGDTGTGKSVLAELLTTRDNCFLYRVEESTVPKIFLRALLKSMRVWFDGSLNENLHRAAEHLNSLDNPLLVIDECSKLSHRMLLCLHDLRNLTDRKCGLLFIGMDYFKNALIAGKYSGKLGMSELFRRVQIWERLEGLSKPEINFILEQHGITDPAMQTECRNLRCIGDLLNKILLYKAFNNQL